MLDLVTCKFDKDPIKNEGAGVETSFFHYTIIILSSTQGRVTLKWILQSSWNLNSYEMLGLSWIPASLAKIRSKMTEKRWRYHFPHDKSM